MSQADAAPEYTESPPLGSGSHTKEWWVYHGISVVAVGSIQAHVLTPYDWVEWQKTEHGRTVEHIDVGEPHRCQTDLTRAGGASSGERVRGTHDIWIDAVSATPLQTCPTWRAQWSDAP